MDLAILNDQEGFRRQVIQVLAQEPLDYLEQVAYIERQRKSPAPWESAGVLLPLFFTSKEKTIGDGVPQYVFLLNKRSKKVQQAGDLCAPGGGVNPVWDKLFQKFLKMGLAPWGQSPGFIQAKQRGKESYEKILFFFGNALRESWEEIHLSPFNVEFLGPLRSYRLQSRQWIIFPVVGRIKRPWKQKLSWEVEKIVPLPLSAFFQPDNYALYSLKVPEALVAQGIPDPWEFPSLVYKVEGGEEILWGATYNIIRSFLQVVFGRSLPSPDGRKVIHRPLVANYFSGKQEP